MKKNLLHFTFLFLLVGCQTKQEYSKIIEERAKQSVELSYSGIKIGDKFAMRGSFDEDVNPFEERRKPIIVEIIDIKTNKIGEKYVQYRYIGDPPYLTFNNKIDIFTELFCKTF